MMNENKIFVGGLPHDCDDAVLQAYFGAFGSVVKIDMKRDMMTGTPRGFAFVTFAGPEMVSAALAVPHEINGKKIDVKTPEPKDPGQKGGGCKGGYDAWGGKGAWAAPAGPAAWGGGWDQWGGAKGGKGYDGWGADAWSGAGAGWDQYGGWGKGGGYDAWGKGYGGGDAWGGGGWSKGSGCKGGKAAGPPQHDFNPLKIFAGGLPKELTDEAEISTYFLQFGAIEKVEMKIDPVTGASRGFCFVTFADQAGANAACAAREVHSFKGKWIDVKSASPSAGVDAGKGGGDAYGYGCGKGGNGYGPAKGGGGYAPRPGDESKVFVGGLKDVEEAEMHVFFGQFGEVKSIEVKKDQNTGLSRGFGFVEFTTPEAAQAVVANAPKNVINGKWIEVRPAAGKGSGKGAGEGATAPLGVGVVVPPPAAAAPY